MTYRGIFDAELSIAEPEQASARGTIIVIGGGAYSWISEREKEPVARVYRSFGFRTAILTYDVTSQVLGLRPLKQAAWAVGKIRICYPGEMVYVCGFSAGGHLAASLGVHWCGRDWEGRELFQDVSKMLMAESVPEAKAEAAHVQRNVSQEGLDKRLFRPDGCILAYPVISGGRYAHQMSFDRLLGPKDLPGRSAEDYFRLRDWFSLELQVSENAVPSFIWHTEEDDSVPVQNTLLFTEALCRAHVPVEYHLYPYGGHGLSLATKELEEPSKKRYSDPYVARWIEDSEGWIRYMFERKDE